jgi:uncharacterized protein YjiS (DUF1127 family)
MHTIRRVPHGGRLPTAPVVLLLCDRWLRRPIDLLLRLDAAARDRRRLLELDDRMLKDIGLSRADVEREAERLTLMPRVWPAL